MSDKCCYNCVHYKSHKDQDTYGCDLNILFIGHTGSHYDLSCDDNYQQKEQWYKHIYRAERACCIVGTEYRKIDTITNLKWEKYSIETDIPIKVDQPVDKPEENKE